MLHFIDFEVFKHDWLCVIISPIYKTETVIINDPQKLKAYYEQYKKEIFVGFNIRNYDQWIFKGLLCDFDPKQINDWIIVRKQKGYAFSTLLNKYSINFYDVMPNLPISLKAMEGFMGSNIKETDVPFNLPRKLTSEEIEQTVMYCQHDVEQTIEVFLHRKNEFDAQLSLVDTFKLPLSHIGKTQAQLAAIILGARRKEFNDEWEIRIPNTLKLKKYSYVAEWFLNPDNHDYKKFLKTNVGGIPHIFAWGGVHGAKDKYSYTCTADELLIMIDVDQLYPTIMIKYNLLSRAVKNPKKFEDILNTSLKLKAEKKKKEREPYKRICNISYGAEGDRFNAMYDPLHRTLVCIFGQLLILDLIEKIEGFCQLIQSNTDGILIKIKRRDFERLDDAVYEWEQRTHLHMSFDCYKSVMQKDVNNYLVVDFEGKCKAKGAYLKDLSAIDYDLPIINRAMKAYMISGVPVEKTIQECKELKEFQKIVKLSSKFDYVEHNGSRYDYKCYRVFASRDECDGKIFKCKNVENRIKKDKFANTPDRCFIENGNVNEVRVPRKLDRKWYIDLTKKRLEQFGIGEMQ